MQQEAAAALEVVKQQQKQACNLAAVHMYCHGAVQLAAEHLQKQQRQKMQQEAAAAKGVGGSESDTHAGCCTQVLPRGCPACSSAPGGGDSSGSRNSSSSSRGWSSSIRNRHACWLLYTGTATGLSILLLSTCRGSSSSGGWLSSRTTNVHGGWCRVTGLSSLRLNPWGWQQVQQQQQVRQLQQQRVVKQHQKQTCMLAAVRRHCHVADHLQGRQWASAFTPSV